MKKVYFIIWFSIFIVLISGGCKKNLAYTLRYDESTMLHNIEDIRVKDINFTNLSSKKSIDLPVYRLDGKNNSYWINYPMTLAKNIETHEIYDITGEVKETLLQHRDELDASIFAVPLEWKYVDELFPLYSKGIVRDLETQLYYRVQRRGGNLHADIQPLSRLDTEMMLRAYDNKWSWDRRAVILQVGGLSIAASINGMPHGSGAISDNDFDGHSCIHFLNSKVHGSNEIDLAHQLMVSKAAGQLFPKLMEMEPEDILKSFFIFSTQNQSHLNHGNGILFGK